MSYLIIPVLIYNVEMYKKKKEQQKVNENLQYVVFTTVA